MSAGLPPANSALRPSRAVLRPSLVEKAATTALTSAFALGSVAACVRASPPANDSFKRPHRPLGSAAVIAMPAIIGLFRSNAHSSAVKLDLSAIDLPPERGRIARSHIKATGARLTLGYVPAPSLRRPRWADGAGPDIRPVRAYRVFREA